MKYLKFFIDKLLELIQALMLKSEILKMILLPKYHECNITLKPIRSDNVNKLFFKYKFY